MMSQLFRIFVDIAIWRRGPQDLPVSVTLTWLVAVIYALASVVQVGMLGWDFRSALLLVLLDLGLQAIWLWGLLAFFGKQARFLQTITAFLGVAALLTFVDVVMDAVAQLLGLSDSPTANPWPLLHLGLVLLLLGRVLQQALERSLLLSMALTLTIMVSISVVARGLVPGM